MSNHLQRKANTGDAISFIEERGDWVSVDELLEYLRLFRGEPKVSVGILGSAIRYGTLIKDESGKRVALSSSLKRSVGALWDFGERLFLTRSVALPKAKAKGTFEVALRGGEVAVEGIGSIVITKGGIQAETPVGSSVRVCIGECPDGLEDGEYQIYSCSGPAQLALKSPKKLITFEQEIGEGHTLYVVPLRAPDAGPHSVIVSGRETKLGAVYALWVSKQEDFKEVVPLPVFWDVGISFEETPNATRVGGPLFLGLLVQEGDVPFHLGRSLLDLKVKKKLYLGPDDKLVWVVALEIREGEAIYLSLSPTE